MCTAKIIGIVGGVGPFAGLDLQHKVAQETIACRDQDHLTVLSISNPAEIPDRTAYLQGEVELNPAIPIARQLLTLESIGAQVVGIPCNTAHATPIFSVIEAELLAAGSKLNLLHMMSETARFLREYHPGVRQVGVLSTTGTNHARVYPAILEPLGFTIFAPDESMQNEVIHPAVYDPVYGIKAKGFATEKARAALQQGVRALHQAGAEAIILGCTEMPLALTVPFLDGLPLLDATRVLARALIREADPSKLRKVPGD